jgi:hypothetical protein
MTVALIALFVALSGSSVAAVLISGANIKNGTVRSIDLKNNDVRGIDVKNGTLTGADIVESKLGTVPKAVNATNAINASKATSADTAGTAGSVNGSKVIKINATVAVAQAPIKVIDNVNGLTITMDCAAGTNVSLLATTSVGGSSISATGIGPNANDNNSARELFSNQTAKGNFNPQGGGGTATFNLASASGNGFETTSLFEYDNPNGSVITGQIYTDEASGCQAHGNVVVS